MSTPLVSSGHGDPWHQLGDLLREESVFLAESAGASSVWQQCETNSGCLGEGADRCTAGAYPPMVVLKLPGASEWLGCSLGNKVHWGNKANLGGHSLNPLCVYRGAGPEGPSWGRRGWAAHLNSCPREAGSGHSSTCLRDLNLSQLSVTPVLPLPQP